MRLSGLRQSGSMKLAFPRTPGARVEAIMINTAGGITGGDRFEIAARAGAGATLSLTTQAAERAYRAQPGEVGEVGTTLIVEDEARLNWLPQELILFDRCALRRRLEVRLAPRARFLMVEPVVFGRAAMNEALHEVFFEDRIALWRDDAPLYVDGMDLRGDATGHLAGSAIAAGAGAMASIVMVDPRAGGFLDPVRALLPATAGASLLAGDMLVVRHLAADSLDLRRALVPILDLLTDNTLPTSWRL